MPSLPDSSGPFARVQLFKLEASRWLFAWWVGLHLILVSAVLMANPPPAAGFVLLVALVWHFRRLRRGRGELLIAGPRDRFALPAAGRFDLALAASPSVAAFWIELSFSDRPGSHFLILRDQLAEPDWRRLSLIFRERP
jgi:Membrane-bound toxin component of toxin-antitoxin system